MKLKDFKGKKVTIIGLGLHGGGVGVAKFFSQLGAKVLVTDLRSKEKLKESIDQLKGRPIKYVLGQHRPEDFINTDLVIKNPAIPEKSRYLEIARENKVPIETDIGIFFELCPAPIIGVTGTKGKSTVATLIAKLLGRKYSEVILAGNIRASVLEKLNKISKESLVVLELSSWQLAGLKSHQKSPHCAVITNLMPDHLNRYKSMAEYIEDKKLIFKWQKSKDYLVLNYDDKLVRDLAKETKSQVFYYSQDNGIILNLEDTSSPGDLPRLTIDQAGLGAFVKGEKIFFGQNKEEICSLDDIQLKGRHNISNVLAAITVAKLYEVSNKSIIKVLNKFKGLEGRLELVDVIDGVKYINDTAATMPNASLAALNSFPSNKNIILIAGGADKNLDFDQLAEMIVKRVKVLILLEGSATAKLKKAVDKQLELTDKQLKIIGPLDNMKKAVMEAKNQAQEKDIVLLSPACASFGLFRHEFERGEAFNKAVALLKK
jgi:UDP-N-acetylmuramoylalanine--D-glutamate ligase